MVLGYNIVDLIDKAIKIAQKRKKLYIDISKSHNDFNIRIISNIIIKNLDRNVSFYIKLKEDTSDLSEKIDFITYDKISFLINQFERSLINPQITNGRELLEFSLDLEEKLFALFVDIQGRIVRDKKDTESNAYKIISKVIKSKQDYVNELRDFIKINSQRI